jgi:hypothetical protein
LTDKEVTTITRADVADLQKAEIKKEKAKAADLEYKKMTKEALAAEAAKRTPPVVIPDGSTKAQIIALLETADAAIPAQ